MLRPRLAILICGIIIASAGSAFSQTEPKARKFAEFGKMSQAGVNEKTESFYLELANKLSSQGYIINYGSPKAIADRRKQITRSVTILKFDPPRVTLTDGPPEKTIRTVMWLVPPGATPPKP